MQQIFVYLSKIKYLVMLAPFLKENVIEAGCDEAGRGCLAGPVYAAAVVLPPDFEHSWLTDSKQLSEKKRYELRDFIYLYATEYAVASFTPAEIDVHNILNASIFSMHKALAMLKTQPEHIIIDGNRFKPYGEIPYTTIIKGDGKYLSIAAASILAKTCRDDYMLELHKEFPNYAWDKNKGYPTKLHRQGIMEHGISIHHRKTFKQLDDQLILKL